ncbi:putative Zf-FLZ domain-containing protein [Rosa chinensis]|uniref:Putative Zf-FLZ domain-containing protein n=1 Tax=Rosa chinensis TaxID=74649 RepID=A0A2P6RWN4_ROSCH|nr:FCS-Like Zinc finger 10 isoform X1 [Rosa chinensis]XP_024186292.1 FCS-Like Zinc finger 10 isoform X1 [Rosa chinensis]PRQ50850.1 putative Zf-FLZ domain-containing protein [Rosa chinensis]
MADSNSLSLKHTSSMLFSIPDFFVGFGNKGSSDSDSVRSPTSPLDLRPFSNLSNPFRLRSARSSSHNGNHKKWDCRKAGLGIVNFLVDETKATSEVLGSSKRKTIIFRPQVGKNNSHSSKLCSGSDDYSMKSQSLPRNYIIRPLSETISLNPQLKPDKVNVSSGFVGLPLESEPSENIEPFLLDSSRDSSLIVSMQGESSLGFKPSSLPVPIVSNPQYASSIPAREMELSEDYTCIISHGPNPKTTHIFCDCILECHTKDLNNVDKEIVEIESPRVGQHQEGLQHDPSDEILRFCYTCKKNLVGEEIYMCRSEKAFCSFDCHSEKIFAEEEAEETWVKSAGSSPESYQEDLFLLGMHSQETRDIE